jgi:ParB family transcriptional regulator, chromosome partitioning protein
MTVKKQSLGRGLSALLENAKTDITTSTVGEKSPVVGTIASIPVTNIETNPFQPRTHFEENALNELADSIKQHGIIQPLTVRKLGYDKYQLISGERRFRASQIAGLKEVPAYIRIANDQDMLEMALVENIQREDLDAIEIALSYKRLIEECSLTQEALSDKVGKQRTTITNYLRLLRLPAEIQLGIRGRSVSMGHARAIINIESKDKQLEIFYKIIEEDLSVRQVEELARGEVKPRPVSKKTNDRKSTPEELSFNDQKVVTDLNKIFNTGVAMKRNAKGGGALSFTFNNETELEHLLSFFDL